MSAEDLRSLGTLQSAINDAAASTSTLWIAFLTFASYLTIAVGGIQGPDILIEKPLTMPILDTAIPLFGFAILSPILLVIFHFYVLLQFQGLAQKATEYNELIEAALPLQADQQLARQRFGNFVLLQLLAGPVKRRAGYTRQLLGFIIWLTVVAAPIVILFLIEIQFLPYHSEALTWLHRSLIALDLILIVAFWTSIRGDSERTGVATAATTALVASLAAFRGMVTACILALAVFVVAFPDEHIYRVSDNRLRQLLFEGDSDPLTPNPESPFANRIIAEDFASEHPLSFRSRNLDRAILRKAKLENADFRNASLVGADLSQANLRNALFDCGGEDEDCPANLRSAQFNGADLRDAQMISVVAIGASFSAAKLSDNPDPSVNCVADEEGPP